MNPRREALKDLLLYLAMATCFGALGVIVSLLIQGMLT